MNQLDTIKDVEGYDVTFMILKSTDNEWITAYVRLTNLEEDEYQCETYRDGEVVGVDTVHYHNRKMSLDQKRIDAEEQITTLINYYLLRKGA